MTFASIATNIAIPLWVIVLVFFDLQKITHNLMPSHTRPHLPTPSQLPLAHSLPLLLPTQKGMSRSTFVKAVSANAKELGFTAWYGLIGQSVTVGAPLIGKMNPWLAACCMALPVASRFLQTKAIAEENAEVQKNQWSFNGKTAAKAMVNMTMFVITFSIGLTYDAEAAQCVLAAWCLSKWMNLGDGSPIEHLERLFAISGSRDTVPRAFPSDRQGFFGSLSSNVSSTSKALFYGVVAMASTVGGIPGLGAPDLVTHAAGKLPLLAAVALTLAPLVARLNQISVMGPALKSPEQVTYFRAKALVGTLLDVGMGGIIFALATLSGVDLHITASVLAGWAGAKLSSGGANSPLEHMEQSVAIHLGGGRSGGGGGEEEGARVPSGDAADVVPHGDKVSSSGDEDDEDIAHQSAAANGSRLRQPR